MSSLYYISRRICCGSPLLFVNLSLVAFLVLVNPVQKDTPSKARAYPLTS
eukprot:m.263421 g.263421  ORF g.263421 m.263421 type:complete len:50 (+) comp26915_c0_seq1:527-676(+)